MNDYVYDISGEGKERWALFKTDGFRLRMKFSAIVLWLSVNDLKKCFKCIRTMFGTETYVKFLYDIDVFITDYAVEYITFEHTKRIRIDKILGIIEKEIDKYEEG